MIKKWLVFFVLFVLLIFTIFLVKLSHGDEQEREISGWFNIIWKDGISHEVGFNRSEIEYTLVDNQGKRIKIHLDKGIDALRFNGKRVKIRGHDFESGDIREDSIEIETNSVTLSEEEAMLGSKPYATLLCRFSDFADYTPHEKDWYEILMGSEYPGMDHYWQELSYDKINLSGSRVFGWYNLPYPKSYYVNDSDGDGFINTNGSLLAEDCAQAADFDVFFPDYYGINLMFNDDLVCNGMGCAFGGSFTFDKDGQSKSYGVTWMPDTDYMHGLMGHEMGHTLGLPHSSGPYGYTYDSRWDVMSMPVWYGNCTSDSEFSCTGVHTISYHKDLLGWLEKKYTVGLGESQTLNIGMLSQMSADNEYLMIKIPIACTENFYAVEARFFSGYDSQVPGEAVVIHHVDISDGATVIDIDGDGDTNDDGAMWLPGESLYDSDNDILVSVNYSTESGFNVTAQNDIAGIFDCPDPDPPVIEPDDQELSDIRGVFTEIVNMSFGSSGIINYSMDLYNGGVVNTGNAFEIFLYLSDDSVFDENDAFLDSLTVDDAIEPEEIIRVSGRTRAQVGENKYIVAVLDAMDDIPEIFENNNVVVNSIF